MDIKLTDSSLRKFLKTSISPEELSRQVSLCGPTFDRITKVGNDSLYEIEVITNRIDTASAWGLARECNAILNQLNIKSELINDPYQEKINLYSNYPKTFNFEIKDLALTPRFTAISLENIKIDNSPEETKKFLTLCGERPINNAVDITNELTLLYGMPIHIFDFDKLAVQKLIIRQSKKGESVSTLDNQKNNLSGDDIVIEDGAGRLVDLCGIMGGSVAEVDQYTKNILLIVPTYDPKKIRRTSIYLQKRTLAAQIYEKQPDTELCLPVLMKAIALFSQRTNARVASKVFDSNPKIHPKKEITINIPWVKNLIGIEIPTKTLISILKSLGFLVSEIADEEITITVPSWRLIDINIREDIVEEIARIYGYSKLPILLPCVNLPPEPKNILLFAESKTKSYLSTLGLNEIYNHSLISETLIKKSKLGLDQHLKLTNSLSSDFEYLRISIIPSLLTNIRNNQGKSEEPFNMYELSNIYQKTKDKLPLERSNLGVISTQDFPNTKGVLETLLCHLNVKTYRFETSTVAPEYFLVEKTAKIIMGQNIIAGYIGYIKPNILHEFGISSNPVVFEMNMEVVSNNILPGYVYSPISEYPDVIEQLTIASKEKIGDIINKIKSVSKLISKVIFIESYQNKHTFKVHFGSTKKGLTQIEVNAIKKEVNSVFS